MLNKLLSKKAKIFSAMAMLISGIGLTIPAQAATREEMIAFVKEAVQFAKKNGKEAAFKAFNESPEFHKGELYIYVFDYKGFCLAHGATPKLRNTDQIGLKDKKDNLLVERLVEAAKSKKGFAYYYWTNPAHADEIEKKSSYVEDVDGNYFVGSGIYLGK